MTETIKNWGNSSSVRIPAAIMESAGLQLDAAVDVREEAGRIVIEPIRTSEYELSTLLDGITSDNLHAEVDLGQAIGREML